MSRCPDVVQLTALDDAVSTVSSATASERAVYVGITYSPFTGGLYRHPTPSGRVELVAKFPYGIVSSPVLTPQRLLIASLGGRLIAFDRNRHEQQWEHRLASSLPTSPIVSDCLVSVDFRGRVVGIDCETGHRLWKRELSGLVDSQPVAADGYVYVAGTDCLAVFSSTDGKCHWKADCETLDAPLLCANSIVVPQTDGSVRCYDRLNGELRWQTQLGSGLVSDTVVDGESVYVAERSGSVHRLDSADGRRLWSRESGDESVSLTETQDGIVSCTASSCRRLDRQTGECHSSLELPAAAETWTVEHGRLIGTGSPGIVILPRRW